MTNALMSRRNTASDSPALQQKWRNDWSCVDIHLHPFDWSPSMWSLHVCFPTVGSPVSTHVLEAIW